MDLNTGIMGYPLNKNINDLQSKADAIKYAIGFIDDQRDGKHYKLKCPQCGRIIWVKKELLRYE